MSNQAESPLPAAVPVGVKPTELPRHLHPFRTNHPASCAYRMHLSPHEWTWTQPEQEAMATALIERDRQLNEQDAAIAAVLEELKDKNDTLQDLLHTETRNNRELRIKVGRQAERIRYLEGAINHAGGTPLSECRKQFKAMTARAELAERRLSWLHEGGDRDPEGYEWGIFRVKWDAQGQPVSVMQTLSDFSDLDAEMLRASTGGTGAGGRQI